MGGGEGERHRALRVDAEGEGAAGGKLHGRLLLLTRGKYTPPAPRFGVQGPKNIE